MNEITQERLKEVMRYEPETGHWFWVKPPKYNNNLVGKKTGTKDVDGRIRVRVDKKTYRSYRLAWLYMTGEWPKNDIDHIDGNPGNDKWANLRDISRGENVRNQKSKGYRWNSERQKWECRYMLNYKTIFVGRFETEQEAKTAYEKAIKEAGLSIPRKGIYQKEMNCGL
jgi:hypothetical protein